MICAAVVARGQGVRQAGFLHLHLQSKRAFVSADLIIRCLPWGSEALYMCLCIVRLPGVVATLAALFRVP